MTIETYMKALKSIGIYSNDLSKEVYRSSGSDRKARNILDGVRGPFIGVGISSGNKMKELGTEKIAALIKLQVSAGEANPSPPVGPALGQHGVNIMEFCKAFNAQTQNIEKGLPTPVVITVYADRSFTFVTKTTPAAVLLRKAAGISKGSGTPNTEKVGTVTRAQVKEIAQTKMVDLNAADIDAAVRIIAGSARSMGIIVEDL